MVKGQKYHMLYKTTCTVTGNFYIGVHSTTNLEDGYLGSGMRLGNSIQKHGKENHTREILEFFERREELMNREREIVNEELLKDESCMNLKPGGEGGFRDEKHKRKWINAGAIASNRIKTNKHCEKLKDKEYLTKWKNAICQGRFEKTGSRNGWKGRKHSESTIENMRNSRKAFQTGSKNSQFGKVWIFHEEKKTTIAVKSEEVEKYFSEGWKKGRKR